MIGSVSAFVRPGARPAAVVVATVGIALLAGCGGSPGGQVAQLTSTSAQSVASAGGSAASPQNGWLAFSSCMRSHGVSRFPDPASNGELPKVSLPELGVSSSRFQAAQAACAELRPAGASLAQESDCLMLGNCPAAEVEQIRAAELRYARCMRSHGVPDWPDPTLDSHGMPVFDVTQAGIGRQFIHSSLFRAPNSECERLTGAPAPRE
jgi:hypothetical protein